MCSIARLGCGIAGVSKQSKVTMSKLNPIVALIKEERFRPSTLGSRGILISSESDKGRVINSASFRRLQQKAQVFPLEPNAAVRTRLTHSIEVSQIGRHLAQKIIQNLDGNAGDYSELAAFVNTVETSCLLHDIGNPPFGHLGEAAIKEWFTTHSAASENDDFKSFDGNPQGFRLISFLAGSDPSGLNLTSTLLLSTIKYPWSHEQRPEGKKLGIFSQDYDRYLKACDSIKWNPNKKFPFAQLMDTADEIAYSMSDLEDGLEKNIIDEDDLRKVFGSENFQSDVLKPFVSFKTKIINKAVDEASANFEKHIDEILGGANVELIEKSSYVGEILEKVKALAIKEIYSNKDAEQVELAGRKIIRGLLDHFGELLHLSDGSFNALITGNHREIKDSSLDFCARLFNRLPIGYREKYQAEERGQEKIRRAHLLVDFISGMTDDFALETYQILEGIRIK